MRRGDLWPGVDVRWAGPTTTRKGITLEPGDRFVVVDPGRHHVPSFATFPSTRKRRSPRPGRGVVVRLADETMVRVRRKHLELVPPDHPLAPEPDASSADWFLEQLASWRSPSLPVAAFVPSQFPAVARVLHPWQARDQRGSRRVPWAEVAARSGFASLQPLSATRERHGVPEAEGYGQHPGTGEFDERTARALLEVLGPATRTSTDVYFAVWEGWGDVPAQRFPGAARLPTPYRGHFLLRGPLEGALVSVAVAGLERPVSGLWWPADHAWFVATDIDHEWTFVTGTEALVDRLGQHPDLEVTRPTLDSPANVPEDPA